MDSMEQAQTIDTYSPSGRLSLLSIPTMLALGGAFGIGAAFIVHLISDWTGFYLIFLFPAGIGFAAGFGLRWGSRLENAGTRGLGWPQVFWLAQPVIS